MRIYNVFYVLLLKHNTKKTEQVNNMKLGFEFEASNNKEYKVASIWDSTIYARKSAIK